MDTPPTDPTNEESIVAFLVDVASKVARSEEVGQVSAKRIFPYNYTGFTGRKGNIMGKTIKIIGDIKFHKNPIWLSHKGLVKLFPYTFYFLQTLYITQGNYPRL